MLLAIDTSTEMASTALYRGEVRAEVTWRAGRNHTAELLPYVDVILRGAGLSPGDLRGVAIALGPGSFNGLRVGLATAKLLSFTLAVPLVGIDTLRVTAQQYVHSSRLIRPLYDAGRGQLATALYEPLDADVRELESPRLATLSDVIERTRERTLFCGEMPANVAQEISRHVGPLAGMVTAASSPRRAGYLAELAWLRLQDGQADDPISLQPLYLQRPPVSAGP